MTICATRFVAALRAEIAVRESCAALRAANQGMLLTSPGRDDLKAMRHVYLRLRDHVKGLLIANLESWEQGSD
jgi:hypothetical protein